MKIINFNNKINISKNEKNITYFSKDELRIILNFYSKQVSLGTWRDYAIDNLNNESFFSIYKHTYDQATYQIVKVSKKGHGNKTYFMIKDYYKMLDKGEFIDRLLSKFEKKLVIKKLK